MRDRQLQDAQAGAVGAHLHLEETLRGSVFIGSPDTVVGKLKDPQRDIGLSGVQLETNCAGLADRAAEREAIRLLAREVKSAFR
jgi:hypothetical protein